MEINNASLFIGDRIVRSGLTFKVLPGEIIGIVAKSGFGKTCFFRSLMGDSSVKLEGIDNLDLFEFSYVPQKGGLINWLTFEEHLRIFDVQLDIGDLSLLGIEGLLSRKAINLSGGEFHRVLLYLASKSSPRYLMLDEPFVALDVLIKERTQEWVTSKVKTNDIGVIMASHDVDLLYSMCDRIYVFNGTGTAEIVVGDVNSEREFKENIVAFLK
jgi:ABC-type nitrate/sulfonate/bicarbonate transport system ATPase subunit